MSVAIAFGLAAVIVGGVVALAIRGAKRSAARLNDAWSEAADRLGLALKPGTWAKSPVLKGSLEGYRVRLEVIAKRSGDSSRRFTRLKVSYPAALGIGLDMRREGTWERVKKAFGAQDITIGDTDFDAGIRVGGSPEGVKMLLTRRRRLAAHRLIEDFPTAMVGDANLKWSDGGVIDDAEEVVSVINRFVSVANALAGDADRAADLDRALEAQARGDVAEAALVLEARTAPDIDPEAAFIEAPTMYAAGRFDRAAEALTTLSEAIPRDRQVAAWLDRARSRAEQAAAGVEVGLPAALTPASVADDLFSPGIGVIGGNERFEEVYEGREVAWEGEVISVTRFHRDPDLGTEGGRRAVIRVHDLRWDLYGGSEVDAVVGLPERAAVTADERARFRGRLARVDFIARNLYVVDAELE